jgi:hypothetical protein
MSDMVKSPKHYTGALAEKLGIEVIDIANALNMNGNRFSILRYVCRAGVKDPSKEIEDLEKIKEYADFEIRRIKGEPVSNTRRAKQPLSVWVGGGLTASQIQDNAITLSKGL